MRRSLLPILLAATLVLLGAFPAVAAEVADVANEAAATGYYVEPGASISESQAGDLVAQMRDAGEGFILVVLSDEPGAGATTFADNVQFAIGRGLILVIAPESIGYAGVGDVFNEVELENALDAALNDGGDDFDLSAAFVSELTGAPIVVNEPVPVPTTAVEAPQSQAEESSGGGSGFLWFIIIVGGIGLLLWWMVRRSKAKARAAASAEDDGRLDKARYLIQEQLNDVANDILALEDEVRVADNERASRFYEQASETYNDVSGELPEANSAQRLVDLSNELDVAIWQLDAAESILDDKPLPERPEPKRLEPAPSAPASPPPSSSIPGPPQYDRRPTRKSSLGAGGIMDLLIAVGGGMMASRGRSSGGGLGDMFRRGPRSSQPSPPPPRSSSSQSGSNPIPGPGRPASPSSSRSTMPKSTRRGTSGRVRSGRKRRRK